jgi:hypothetical protein
VESSEGTERKLPERDACADGGEIALFENAGSILDDSGADETCNVISPDSCETNCRAGSAGAGGMAGGAFLKNGAAAQVPSAKTPKASQRHD